MTRKILGSIDGPATVKDWEWPSSSDLEVHPAPETPRRRGWTPTDEPEEKRLPGGIQEDSTHAYVFQNAGAAAAVLRTIQDRNEGGTGDLSGLDAEQIVAAVLLVLGDEVAPTVFRHMGGDALESATRAISNLSEVTHARAMTALEMVRRRIETGDYLEYGGEGRAREFLEKALGGYGARAYISRAKKEKASGFELLQQCAPDQVASLLQQELPQTVALILANLNPDQGAAILSHLPESMQADVSRRIGSPGEVEAGVLDRVVDSMGLMELAERTSTVGGAQALGSLLEKTSNELRERLVTNLEKEDRELSTAVRQVGGEDSEEGNDG